MEGLCDCHWLCEMADILTREIVEEMSRIKVRRCEKRSFQAGGLDTVCGRVEGELSMELRLRAESGFFCRLAEGMMEEKPEDMAEVQEYATEFFNTLCGRFISEIYQAMHISARFHPVHYETSQCSFGRSREQEYSSVCFESDRHEYVEFSWTKESMEKLLRRSGVQ